MGDLAKDLFCGWLSGIGQVLTMMPFENVKIKVVSMPDQYTGYLQCIKKTIAEQGPFSFYKGMLTNLLGVGPQVALQFGTVETLKKYIKRNFESDKERLSLHYISLCGAIAGLPSALVVTPLDHARFRVALSKTKVEGGSVGKAKEIFNTYGLRKLYLGFNSTLCRESLCLIIYFSVYEIVNRWLNPDPKKILMINALLAGGISGVVTWAAAYPFDFVKTLIQTDNIEKPRHNSMMAYFKEELSKGSIRRIFTGIQIMLVRAFVVNGTGFVCFETGKKLLYGNDKVV